MRVTPSVTVAYTWLSLDILESVKYLYMVQIDPQPHNTNEEEIRRTNKTIAVVSHHY